MLWHKIPTNATTAQFFGNRGITYAGYTQTSLWLNIIDYISIPTPGNAVDFGDSIPAVMAPGGAAGKGRAVFAGGGTSTPTVVSLGTTDYITISTPGNSVDFGTITVAREGIAGLSDGDKGFFIGGALSNDTTYNTIDYVTILTVGNAVDFGDITTTRAYIAGMSGKSRGVFSGGHSVYQNSSGTNYNIIEYFNPATPSNSIDFGDLTVARMYCSGGSNGTRGLTCGGAVIIKWYNNTIDYITISTTGNATDFGDISIARRGLAVSNNQTRCVISGGQISVSGSFATNVIDYVTISTPGNAADFGDLTAEKMYTTGVSGN